MPCEVPNLTTEQIKDALLNKKIKDLLATEDLVTKAKIMRETNRMVSTQEVDADLLNTTVRRQLNLKKGDTVARYVLDNKLLAQRRTTDEATRKFIRFHGEAKATYLSNQADTRIKADVGTRLHDGAERLLTTLIEQTTHKNLVKLSDLDGQPVETITDAQLQELTGLKGKNFDRFKDGIKGIINLIVETQQKIDPDGQVIILPEQFVLDPIRDIGSKVDIGGFFSDGTHINLDYKSMTPSREKIGVKNEILDPDWIPFYKEEALFDQLSVTNHTLETFYGSQGASLSRGIPIHTRFKLANKIKDGETIVDTITHLAIGPKQDAMLEHIPVQEMVVLKDKQAADEINKSIGVLTRIINNRQKRLEQMEYGTSEYTKLASKIKNNRKALNKLILHQDSALLLEGFNALLSKISKDGRLLQSKNIDSPEINGKPNPDYMSNDELMEFIREVEAFKNIIDSSGFFQEELNLLSDSAAYQDYLTGINMLSGQASRLTKELKTIVHSREFTPEEREAMKDTTPGGWFNRLARTLGEQVAVPFRKLRSHLDRAQNKRRLASQRLFDETTKQNKKLEDYAKKIGKSVTEIFDMMINPKTENLWGKHSKDFYDDLQRAQERKDSEWVANNLELKSDARQKYNENLEAFKRTRYNYSEQELNYWIKENKPENAVYGKKWWLYYEPKQELSEKYYSDGYKEIRQHSPILEYYNFYTDTMADLLDRLGFKGDEKLPRNFLPYIRQDILGIMAQGTFDITQIQEAAEALYHVREDDTGLGDMTTEEISDPVTGRTRYGVPRYFTNPIRDSKGKIKRGMKLTDLSKSLTIFGEMAYNYDFMKSEVEPHLEAIRDLLVEEGSQQLNSDGRKKKLKTGLWSKLRGEGTTALKQYDRYVNYHVYGIKIQNADRKWVKRIQNLKTYQALKELAISPLLWIGNMTQIQGNAIFEGINGYFYTKGQYFRSVAEGTGAISAKERSIYGGLAYLFEFSPKMMDIRRKDLSRRFVDRWMNTDTLFFGMRKAEQAVNNNIGVSVLRNHAIVNGELVRISKAPKGAKSIRDSTFFNDKGYLEIEGITDSEGNVINEDLYAQIRNLALSVSNRVKGQMNPDDLSAAYMDIAGNVMLGFKTWMPGMADARFTSLRYSPASNAMVMGKYQALLTEMKMEDRAWYNWLGNVVAPTMGKFLANAATFGAYNFVAGQFGEQFKLKVNEQRAKRLFDQYKEQFKHDAAIQNMKFEDYVEFKQGQLRSLAAELSTILAIVGMVMALRVDWDDDGEAEWRKNWQTRTFYRSMNRARRELAFFISPNDWTSILRMPAPIMSLPVDATNALYSALDGVGDIITGEDPVTDRERSKFWPMFKFTPGHKFIQFLERQELDELREV